MNKKLPKTLHECTIISCDKCALDEYYVRNIGTSCLTYFAKLKKFEKLKKLMEKI